MWRPVHQAVSHTEREELYQDYLRDAERRQREEKKRVRKQHAAAFRDLLLSTTAIKVPAPHCLLTPLLHRRGCVSNIPRTPPVASLDGFPA